MGAEAEMPDPEALQSRELRLLPWASPEGKPSYLITDSCGGRVSRLADATEAVQLGMGAQLLAHAHDVLPNALAGELRFLAERLTEALRDARCGCPCHACHAYGGRGPVR